MCTSAPPHPTPPPGPHHHLAHTAVQGRRAPDRPSSRPTGLLTVVLAPESVTDPQAALKELLRPSCTADALPATAVAVSTCTQHTNGRTTQDEGASAWH